MIIWSFNCLIAHETKCCLCKGSDFIMCFMTCMLKHINTTMQAFTRITGSNMPLFSSSFVQKSIYLFIETTMRERDEGK